MDTKDVIQLAVQIEKSNNKGNYEDIMSLLTTLNEANITVEHLQGTDIVGVLYRVLKNCSHPAVKKRVKQLLSNWKKLYSQKHREHGKSSDTCTAEAKMTCLPSDGVYLSVSGETVIVDKGSVFMQGVSETGSRSTSTPAEGTECVQAVREEMTSSDGHSASGCRSRNFGPPAAPAEATSPVSEESCVLRSKCAQLLLSALQPEEREGKTAELARSIEEHVYTLHSVNQAKYKACIRSKVANLRNPNNGHLRQGLLSGSLGPEAFARMSVQEMASEELQRLRGEYSARGVSERQLPGGLEGTPTQKLRCRRCEGSDCTVSQVSRGTLFLPAWVRRGNPAEDAMTFVTCGGCGEHWYHSGWVCL